MTELARAIGVSETTIHKYVKRPDWPFGSRGPWTNDDVTNIQEWRKGLQANTGGPGFRGAIAEKKQVADWIKAMEQAKLTRTKREVLEAKLIPVGPVQAAFEGAAQLFSQHLSDMIHGLPFRLQGLDAGEIEDILRHEVKNLMLKEQGHFKECLSALMADRAAPPDPSGGLDDQEQ